VLYNELGDKMIEEKIVNWYRINKRNLPFRSTNDPYLIWVSEVMAQQTRIETMLPYYERWIKKYPTIINLAASNIDDVLKSWEGLGYYRRARYLHSGALFIQEKHNGIFPTSIESIREIPGIGDYTSAAIASIVFKENTPAIDGNVIRVVSRISMIEENSTSSKVRTMIKDIVSNWMYNVNSSDLTQGLMELGALICLPRNPKCDLCPLKRDCVARENNKQNTIPIKSSKKGKSIHRYRTFICTNDKEILVSTEWSDGLMKGLYRLPQIEEKDATPFLVSTYLGTTKHIYSHKIWVMDIYSAKGVFEIERQSEWKWININDVQKLPWISAHRKILETYL